ncbi:MAG: outer membrane lipid asymmetry maintenance protein MlaD [Proteobacteria bacterium]|nr:outer membrane lipid asymmetry maintenance protein MlaD [Pseudomonadota bacterium]NCA27850.1 outer membrane lipid asymmetry maintenance protein MlaD [Pseudomonadota bacterium]
MNKIHNFFDFLVGTIVLVVAITFLVISFKSSKISSDNGYKILAKFDNADGINIGSDIKISGVKIGTIAEQNLDSDSFQAVLKFNIYNHIKIPSDSSAKIVSEGLLGSKYIAITPGGNDEFLKEGQEINFTQSSINFEELLGKFIFNGKDNNEKK